MKIGTVGALTLSVTSSVSIVIVNKYLISTLGFRYVTFLTSLHMVVTVFALRAAHRVGLLEPKPIDRGALLRFAALNAASIAFLNLSLGFNSVGFYQMTKLAIIPCTVAIQQTFYDRRFSPEVKLALAVLLLGVAVATVTDLQLNLLGSILSLLALVTTCVSQIWTNTMQKQYGVTSTQLLHGASPFMALTLGRRGAPRRVFGRRDASELRGMDRHRRARRREHVRHRGRGQLQHVPGHREVRRGDVPGFGPPQDGAGPGGPVLRAGRAGGAKNVGGILLALVGMVAYGTVEQAERRRAGPSAAGAERVRVSDRGGRGLKTARVVPSTIHFQGTRG